jgi:hypothetical protein
MSVESVLRGIYEREGRLSPELLVQIAQPEDHPLHQRFEWDDSVAGPLYRREQAAQIIRSARIVIEREAERPPVSVRAFVAREEMGLAESPGEYVPVTEVVASDVMRTAWFRRLQEDWQRLKSRAAGSQEFAAMVLSDLRADAG